MVVDGVTELDRWGGLGLDPDDLLNPDLPLLPPADGTPAAGRPALRLWGYRMRIAPSPSTPPATRPRSDPPTRSGRASHGPSASPAW